MLKLYSGCEKDFAWRDFFCFDSSSEFSNEFFIWLAREYERFGNRILEHGDMYDEHSAFIKWAKEYDNGDETIRSKAMHDKWSTQLSCKQIVLDGTKPVDENLELLKQHFNL